MENIDEMRERHRKEIEELQKKCRHKSISGWLSSMWAPGHFGGNVKICDKCGKVMETISAITTGSVTTSGEFLNEG